MTDDRCTTHFSLLPGRPATDLVREVVATMIARRWLELERHGDLVSRTETSGIEAIVDFYNEHGQVVIEGGGQELALSPDRQDRTTHGYLALYTPLTRLDDARFRDEHEALIGVIAKLLSAPVSGAGAEPALGRHREIERDGVVLVQPRLRGYREGLLGLYWRNVFGPPFTKLFGDRVLRLPPEVAHDLGDGFWFVQPYERPQDYTTDEARRRERELIDILGRDLFYDMEREKKPTRRPTFDVPNVNRYVIAYRSSSGFSIDKARYLLVGHGFTVAKTDGGFAARWRDQEVRVRAIDLAGARAEIEARAYLEDTERAQLAASDAAIEVTFDDLGDLSEVNAIRSSERLLRDASRGLLFQRWDDSVFDPVLAKMSNARFTVLFSKASGFSLERARDVLVKSEFRVGPIPDGYSARWQVGPVLYLRGVSAKDTRAEIEARIGKRPELAKCDGAIEVAFDDLDAALDEANTLIESQLQLAPASGGFVFLHWNETLQRPDA